MLKKIMNKKQYLLMQAFKSFSESEKSLKKSRPQFRILPNVGNTCFLNSAVQALYQIYEIRQSVKEYKGSKDNILHFLRILFQQMSKQTHMQQKSNTLKNIQTSLETCLIDYVRERQHDAFETFLFLFNLILQKDPSLSQHFQIEYSLQCNCNIKPRVFLQLKIDAQEAFCGICKRQFSMKILKVPAYLIVFEGYGKQANKVLSNLEAKEIDKIVKVIYCGNKKIGHYFALCREDKFYSLNDYSYSEITRRYYNSQQCQFSIYGKVQPIQEEPILYEDIMNQFLEKVVFLLSVSIIAPIAFSYLIRTVWPKVISLGKLGKEKIVDKIMETSCFIFRKISF